MSASHHPTSHSLARFAAGTLDPGAALVIAAHLETCPHCARTVGAFEAVGGAMLENIGEAPVSDRALDEIMARLDDPWEAPVPAPYDDRPGFLDLPDGFHLPQALRGCRIGPWRRFGAGARWSYVALPGAGRAHARLLRIGAGRHMPHHGHSGSEFTLVLHGAFADGNGRYSAGDLAETDEDIVHQPIVEPDGECICLAAIDGDMRLPGFFGRLAQPFVRF